VRLQHDQGHYDAIVVGGGPAGLAAAVWLARYRRRALVLDPGGHRNQSVEHVHGYLGLDGQSAASVLGAMRADLARYPQARLRRARAVDARRQGDGFALDVDDMTLWTRRVVLATGVRDVPPQVAGFEEHYGAGAFHCPTCDGYEARARRVVVFGWGAGVVEFALELLEWASVVTVVTDGRNFRGDDEDRSRLAADRVAVLEDEAVELVGTRGALRAVRLAGGDTLECEYVFFSIGHEPVNELAVTLGCDLTPEGCVEVDENGATSVPGVYAAGDVTPGLQLVQVAAAKGTIAGVACAESLR
jgi:thioredoxin reductase